MTTAELELATANAAPPDRERGRPRVELHLEKLWDRNISLTTRLVDTVTTPMLLRSGKLQPGKLVTHRFAMNDSMKAYDTFGNAAREGALKVALTNAGRRE
jgi:alcohol dehydrogenase